ncbi:MAG TPA: glycosyltransferase [Candidatus Saccharimonadales bacterium]|nr:glycosyltransferase [Candidatus Saccharimonadales bacterium]
MPKQTKAAPADTFVSVVVVTDEHSSNLHTEVRGLSTLLKKRYANYEIILVDNRVPKRELQKVVALLDTTPCVRVLRLSRADSVDVCVFAGLEAAIGDIVVIKTLHDPVAAVPAFVHAAEEYDLVFGVSKQRLRASWVNHHGARLFYWYNKKFLKISIPENATYFMALDRRAVNAMTRSNRHARHIRYMARLIGYSSKELAYDTRPSFKPERKPVRKLVASALELSTNYSNRPLRFLAWLGFLGSALNLLYAGYVVLVVLFKHNVAQGWPTQSLQSAAMFFLLFAILAFMCEYLGNILQQSRGETPYHIADELLSKVSVADATRRNIAS